VAILVVDPNPIARTIVQTTLESHGHLVLAAADTAEAEALAASHPLDLVIQDDAVLDEGGAAIARLRARAGSALPLLHLTHGLSSRETAPRAVMKPIAPSELLAQVKSILAGTAAPPPAAFSCELGRERRLALRQVDLAALGGFSLTARRRPPFERLVANVFPMGLDALGATQGAVYLRDGEGRLARFGEVGLSERALAALTELVSRRVSAKEEGPVQWPSAAGDEARSALDSMGAAALLAVPVTAYGETLGMFVAGARRSPIEPEWLELAAEIGAQLGRAVALWSSVSERAAIEHRYRGLFEAAGDAMLLADADGHILDANAAARHLTQYSRDEFHRVTLSDLLPSLGPAAAGESPSMPRALRGKTGSPRLVEASENLLAPYTRVVTLRDVTDREHIQDRLRQSEKLAAMTSLVAGVAHELSNPLSVILTGASLLEGERDPTATERWRTQIARAAERCARIVASFLAVARRHPAEQRSVDLNHVVEATLELLAYRLRTDDIEVRMQLDPARPRVEADSHQMEELIVNLATNAQQAMKACAPPRQLVVATREDPSADTVLLEVTDSGPGVSTDIVGRIFEPFFTTKPSGEGAGLGLSLCQRIVESHHGTIRVAPAHERGAVFTVELPRSATRRAAPAVTRPPDEAIVPCSILIVDDETEVAWIIREVLGRDGHEVVAAAEGSSALDLLDARPFDLVLTDVRMPGMDGVRLFREASRRHPQLADRFIFMTGDTLSPATRELLERSRATRLTKPFSSTELRQAVRVARTRR
jgi:PAS domain S-box-containing protein